MATGIFEASKCEPDPAGLSRTRWFARVVLRDGRRLEVQPLLFGRAVLDLVGADGEIIDSWEFDEPAAALVEAELFNPLDEPEPHGWTRHPGTGRRRPGGDAAGEFVRR